MNQLQAIRNALLTALRIIDENSRVRKADGGTLTYIDPVTGLPRQGMDTPKNFFAPEIAESAGPNFAPLSQIANNYPGGAFEPDDFGPGQTQPGGGAGPAAANQPDFNKSLPGTESPNYGRIGGFVGSLAGPAGYVAGRTAGTALDVNAVNKAIRGYGFGEELTPEQIASGVANSMSFGLAKTPMGEAATQNINAGVKAFEQDPANAGFMARTTADDLAGPGGPQSDMATGSTSAGSTGFGGQEQDVDAAANEAASSETESASESESESESEGGGDGGDGGDAERRGGRVYHKASGGSTMPIHDHAQAVRAALLTARGMADGGETKDKSAERPVGSATVGSLAKDFDDAIAHHLSLSMEDRKENSKRVKKELAEYIGPYGKLLGKNAKLMKAEAGFQGGTPITIPGTNNGVETAGLTLAPAFKEGKFISCPNSGSCAKDCLGLTSGSNFIHGGGSDLEVLKGPRLTHVNKMKAMLRRPDLFAVKLFDEIQASKMLAAKNGNHFATRLNVLSDINPRIHKSIIENHPDVSFYDYTKNNTDPIAPNHHYTYSSTGISHKEGVSGISQDVDNKFQNWKSMRKRLDEGSNVAMPFSHKTLLPESVFDEETGKKYKVIDGDTHDFRPLDSMTGNNGVIVGLRNKNMMTKGNPELATVQSNGFITHYNPEVSGSTEVNVPMQNKSVPTMTNDMKVNKNG